MGMFLVNFNLLGPEIAQKSIEFIRFNSARV